MIKTRFFNNSDRTSHNRRNSDYLRFFNLQKSEKFRFLRRVFTLFFCYYCYILINILIKRSSRKNRTTFNINVNTGENRKKSDFTPKVARIIYFDSQCSKFLLYSPAGTRARRKKLKPSRPLVHFLRSLDALYCFPKAVVLCGSREQRSPKREGFQPSAWRGISQMEATWSQV